MTGLLKTVRTLLLIVFTPIFVAAFIVAFLVLNWDGPSRQQGEQRAGTLIVALERYRQRWGKHPTVLTQLIPNFLSDLPRPGWRYEYHYVVCDEGVGYILEFPLGHSDDVCGFISESTEWICIDSLPPSSFKSACPNER